MKSFNFKKVDAFTKEGSSGNPVGCIYLENPASKDEMQQVALELKGFVSEVVYCLPIVEQGTMIYSLLYYSSEREVEFCGHGTLACMYDLISNDPELVDQKEIRIRTQKGDLMVHNHIPSSDAVYIASPAAQYLCTESSLARISAALQIPDSWIDKQYPVDLINAGLNTLIVPIINLKSIVSIWPDINMLKSFCIANSIDIIAVYTMDVANKVNKVHSRVFAPRFGYLEDPATGSGNSALGYYLLKNRLWEGSPISIEQGPSLESPNIVKLDTVVDQNGDKRVLFGGRATVRIAGRYFLV
ncbi:MAG TPA: PhzF family phenazine biosynthesis protein [Syntrophomonadaceae bacterium]|nr:PhzF family phenazine biosynthesis protein [Syntrophomonadaceae bacterium]